MKLLYKPQALKQYNKLPKNERSKVHKKLGLLSTNPLSGKLLKGDFADLYSLRAWPYRIVYGIEKGEVIIYSIAHRQGVYRN